MLNIRIFEYIRIFSVPNIFISKYIRLFSVSRIYSDIRSYNFCLPNIFGYSFGLFSATWIYSNIHLDYYEHPKYIRIFIHTPKKLFGIHWDCSNSRYSDSKNNCPNPPSKDLSPSTSGNLGATHSQGARNTWASCPRWTLAAVSGSTPEQSTRVHTTQSPTPWSCSPDSVTH